MKAVCAECGWELECVEKEDGTYSIEPCSTCINEAFDDGYDAGYDDGDYVGKSYIDED